MTYRDHAHASLNPGHHEQVLGGERVQLVTVTLTDLDQRPDVLCSLRPTEARALAGRLLALADHADRRPIR